MIRVVANYPYKDFYTSQFRGHLILLITIVHKLWTRPNIAFIIFCLKKK